MRTSGGALSEALAAALCAAASSAQVASLDIGGMWSPGASAGGRRHRPIGWDQAMIGYFHVRRTVRDA